MMDRWRYTRFVETFTGALAVVLAGLVAGFVFLALVIGTANMMAWIAERV